MTRFHSLLSTSRDDSVTVATVLCGQVAVTKHHGLGAGKQQAPVSRGPGGWEVQDRGPNTLKICWNPAFYVAVALLGPHMVQGR